MTPDCWLRICAVFEESLRQPDDARPAFLERACGGDVALRAEVEELLDQDRHAEQESFLTPMRPLRDRLVAPAAARLTGARLGPYLVGERVGGGGMGDVYRAVRIDDYRQEVAVKVVKAGLGVEEVLARFRTERQALADLRHANIARLLDGGTTPDGLPYLVLEFIDGRPIDRHCDDAGLPVRERVRLLRAVCLAVTHAHEHGVLHRDLKPGNVLVTVDGTPRVTDFGTAKLLTRRGPEQTEDASTGTGAVVGTPSYMPPEQASGQPVGPLADVYALGALLYQLLTGRPPFQGGSLSETLNQVCTEEPVAPSRLQAGLPRDLETICLKCLEKEPQKRYASAAALADDLGRFLNGEPVRARPVGAIERGWRWCRRNRRVAGLLVALVLVVAGGFAGVTALWLVARAEQAEADRQRQRAEDRQRLARRAADGLTRLTERWLDGQTHIQPAQLEALETALAPYLELGRQDEDAAVLFRTAQVYHFIARAQHHNGQAAQAEANFRRQLALLQRLEAEYPDEPRYRFDNFHCRRALSGALRLQGRRSDGENEARAALQRIRELVEDYPDQPFYRDSLAHQCGEVAGALCERGQFRQAERLYHEGLTEARALVAKQPRRRQSPFYEFNVICNLRGLAELALLQGHVAQAEERFRQAADEAEQAARGRPALRELVWWQTSCQCRRANLLRKAGRSDEAGQALRAALQAADRLAREHPDFPLSRVRAMVHAGLGYQHYLAGQSEAARAAYRQAVEVSETVVGDFPNVGDYHQDLAWLLCTCPVQGLRDPDRGLKLARRAVELTPSLFPLPLALAQYRLGNSKACLEALDRAPAPTNPVVVRCVAFVRAMALWQLDRCDQARQVYQEAILWMTEDHAPDPELCLLRDEADRLIGSASTPDGGR